MLTQRVPPRARSASLRRTLRPRRDSVRGRGDQVAATGEHPEAICELNLEQGAIWVLGSLYDLVDCVIVPAVVFAGHSITAGASTKDAEATGRNSVHASIIPRA